MSGPDVKQLAQESVPNGSFPVSRQSDYRVFIAPEVHSGIHAHASEKTDVEICGVVVGTWERDADGPFARIANYIRCDSATKKFAEVTFTHESWSHINKEMDTKYPNLRIIGWYHSHPDFGIFLSDRDGFIQQNFFSGPGQVAFVVDPVRHLEGLFEWRDGKTELISHYWVGNKVVTSAESKQSRVDRAGPTTSMANGLPADRGSIPSPAASGSIASTALTWLSLFLLGYLLHGVGTSWYERMLREGTVAHYGVINLLMFGWDDRMRETRQKLEAVSIEVKLLAEDHARAAGEQGDDVRKRWRTVREQLAASTDAIDEVRDQYALGEAERRIYEHLIREKIAELSGVRPRERTVKPNAPSNKSAPEAKPKEVPKPKVEAKPKDQDSAPPKESVPSKK